MRTSHEIDICSFCHCSNDPEEKGDLDKKDKPRDLSGVFNPAVHYTVCLLHAKLRISGTLLELTAQHSVGLGKQGALQDSIREVGIDMTVSHEKKTKKVKCATMNGPDCEKLMSKRGEWISVLVTKKNTETHTKLLKLWDLWDHILQILNRRYDIDGPSSQDLMHRSLIRVKYRIILGEKSRDK